MRLALALQTLVGLTLLVALAAGVDALLRGGPALTFPWPPLSPLRTAAVLVLTSLLWLLVDGPAEGRVLLSFTANRGITAADVLVLPALGLAALLLGKAVLPHLR